MPVILAFIPTFPNGFLEKKNCRNFSKSVLPIGSRDPAFFPVKRSLIEILLLRCLGSRITISGISTAICLPVIMCEPPFLILIHLRFLILLKSNGNGYAVRLFVVNTLFLLSILPFIFLIPIFFILLDSPF